MTQYDKHDHDAVQATCGGSCFGAGAFYCLMAYVGLHVVPQCITRSEIRKMNGMQVRQYIAI